MSERVPVKIAEWDATENRLAGDVRAWVTPGPCTPLRSALPSLQYIGDFEDEAAIFHRLGHRNETTDPVRHPEGREDPTEYA